MKYELTEKKAAQLLGVSVSRISQLIGEGKLDYVTIRGNVRISEESLRAYSDQGKPKRGRPPKSERSSVAEYMLMNADHEVGTLQYDSSAMEPLSLLEVLDAHRAPLGVLTRNGNQKKHALNQWWVHRSIPSTRPGLDAKLLALGVSSPMDAAVRSLGLSLSDCYWLRPADAPQVTWASVNYFENDFVDSSESDWDGWLSGVGLSSPDNTSEGELPKKWVIGADGVRYLLKGCRTDDQRPYNEVVATALFRRLLDPDDYVPYDIAETADGSACRSADFVSAREEYVPAALVRDMASTARGKNMYDRFCATGANLGADAQALRTSMSKMIVCDAILANSDRHWRNFGFVRDVDTLALRAAPLFDSGNSLWYWKAPREVSARDWAFAARPFAFGVHAQLAFVDDIDWFDPSALGDFADEACDILQASSWAAAEGRLDFIHQGIERNVALVTDAAKLLKGRIERFR